MKALFTLVKKPFLIRPYEKDLEAIDKIAQEKNTTRQQVIRDFLHNSLNAYGYDADQSRVQ